MEIEINGKTYPITITRKPIKNMYLRIKEGPKIEITASNRISEKDITKFVENNIKYIYKHVTEKQKVTTAKEGKFEYLGHYYDIVYTDKRGIDITDTIAYIGKSTNIDNWYKKEALEIFTEYYNECLDNFKESNKRPILKIRRMRGKWGVCNVTNNTITLNQELIKLEPICLEYVIYHELSHLVHHNHSKNFWNLVEKYVPDYKKIRKSMKNV